MGLDYVGLIMGVESSFKITIEDEEASHLDTVGKLYECILEKLNFNSSRRCLSSAAFYETRRAFVELFGAPRNEVTPGAKVESLLPVGNRKAQWQKLGKKLDVSLPDLERPDWLDRIILCLYFCFWLFALIASINGSQSAALISFIGSFAYLWLALCLTSPFATRLPPGCSTVRGLVESILRLNYGAYIERRQCWNPAEVWEILRAIIVDELEVKREQVRAGAHFVQDLMML